MKHYTITIEDSFGGRRHVLLTARDKHHAVNKVPLKKGEHIYSIWEV